MESSPPAELESQDNKMNDYYAEGLRLAVETGKMTPELAKQYFYNWTGEYRDF